MTLRPSAITLLCGLLLSASTSSSAAETRTFTVRGAGSCGDWVQARKKDVEGAEAYEKLAAIGHMRWMNGFLSGLNALSEVRDVLRDIDNDTIAAWLDRYCAKNPSKDLSDAGQGLFLDLQRLNEKRN